MISIIYKGKAFKRLLVLITLLITASYTFAQTSTEAQKTSFREIYGFVRHSGTPLTDVNIIIKNSNRGTKTNNKGYYDVKAKKGESLLFTYVGMNPVEVIVEDVTKVLNIEMQVMRNALDEVTVKTKRKQKVGFTPMNKPRTVTTSRGTIDIEKAGYSISYVEGKDLNLAATNLAEALLGKLAGFRIGKNPNNPLEIKVFLRGNYSISLSTSAIWDIDGVIYNSLPPLDLTTVKDVYVIRSLAGTVAYGQEGSGGVIVVRTKTAIFDEINISSKPSSYKNEDYYQEDALQFKNLKLVKTKYHTILDTINNSENAYILYQKMSANYKTQSNFYLDFASYFLNTYKDNKRSLEVLFEMEKNLAKNPEALKALAYTYQERNLHQKAINIYKQIIELRPNYAQSFRDFANAYTDNKQYLEAWKIYMNYLYRGNALDDKGIGQIIYNEMEALYIKNKINIKENFVFKDSTDTTSDIRMVFEWNTTEAEFILEFVNPKKQSYSIEHSLFADNDRISDEKVKGYSSEEFIIKDLNKLGGENWLVNITYLGNKKYVPTYFKTTVYYNWGYPNQTEKIQLFKLTKKNVKVQLLKLNTKFLVLANNKN